ncbi:MAG: hypothetical protein V1818_03750 [Candidatus Aenigmatarchaeota archaeon]
MGLGPEAKLILKILSIVIVLAVIMLVFLPLFFGINIIGLLTQTPDNLGDIFLAKDFDEADMYEGYELIYDGMVLPKDGGEDSISNELRSYEVISDCSGCTSCGTRDLEGMQAVGCDSCSVCNEIDEPGRFENCLGCQSGRCMFCDDENKYELCKEIKSCILEYYGDSNYKDVHGCFLRQIPHNDGTSFNIDVLKSVLDTCVGEPIMINMGNDFVRELCYFDPNFIAFYDVSRPEDYYMKHEMNAIYGAANPSRIPSIYRNILESDVITPFYMEDNEVLDRYRIYISFTGTPNGEYKILGGYLGANYEKEFTMVTTDSNGLWYGELGFPEEWRSDVDDDESKNKFNFIWVRQWDSSSVATNLNGAVYLNDPESGYIWSHDLRFSKCNFETNPEPYLDPRPWWVYGDLTESPLTKNQGSQDSAIKVFYDSNMPGGGNSDLRGNIKLQIGRLDTDFQRNCMFDIYVCSQDALAEYEGENILNINDFMINFDPLYVNKVIDAGSHEIILYNYFELELDRGYTADEIRSALKSGFRVWEHTFFPYASFYGSTAWIDRVNNDGIYQGTWLERMPDVSYDNDCWSTSVQNLMTQDSRFIVGGCEGDMCTGKLKIRIAFKYEDPKDNLGIRQFLYPTVTFCSSEEETPPEPPQMYPGLVGTCEEVYDYHISTPGNPDYCQFSWGKASCNAVTGDCSCAPGATRQTLGSFFTYHNTDSPPGSWLAPFYETDFNGYGFLIGCVETTSSIIERPTGVCTLTYDIISQNIKSCDDPPSPLCQGSEASSQCLGSPREVFQNYKWGPGSSGYNDPVYGHTYMTTAVTGSNTILGTCQEYWNVPQFGVYSYGRPPTPVQKTDCRWNWGSAECDEDTHECSCPEGPPTEIVNGYIWNPDVTTSYLKPGYGRLYACIG